MDAGIVPVKALGLAKGRLGSHFSQGARLEIARAMLRDTLDLCSSVQVLQWWVVSTDPEVLQAASQRGFGVVEDVGRGLNAALHDAVEVVARRGASSVTVVPADVPLAWRGDVEDLLDTGATSDMVVVPSSRDGGTNALYLEPPDVIEPRFGSGSLRAHVAEAERRGIRCSILPLPRLALDIDTIDDVDAFLAKPRRVPSHTADALGRLRANV